jgi:hypothetical protein
MEKEDKKLWRLAKKRADFKRHAITYVIVNIFLWLVWLFTKGGHMNWEGGWHLPWPAWVSLGWGIGLAMNYFPPITTREILKSVSLRS